MSKPTVPSDLAHYIDHTLLRPEATETEIRKTCAEAREFGFKTVCIEPKWVALAARELSGSSTIPITVISFPHGNDPTAKKVSEATSALNAGARELDMVLNRDLLKTRNYAGVLEDVKAIVKAAGNIPVKVILETSELTDSEKVAACVLCKLAGAKFVKTSTGFSKAGATENDVRLMRDAVGSEMGVKASGGVRTLADAEKMLLAGANRLGTSAGVAIVRGAAGSGTGAY